MNRENKYNARTCKCLSGHIHDSRGEANYCNRLLADVQDRKIKDYEIQKCIRIYVAGKHICNHYVDFLVTLNNGAQEYREYKGFSTQTWAIKKKLIDAIYPEIPYIVIKHKQ